MKSKNLKSRMSKVLPLLEPFYLIKFLRVNTKYDTFKGRNRIEAVVGLKMADEDLTELFEKHVGL